MMAVQLLAIDNPAWANFVSGQEQAAIFHHPAWTELLTECYGYKSFVLACVDAKGDIAAGMPFIAVNSPLTGYRWVSLPFSDYCPPLYRDDAAVTALVEYLVSQNRARAIPRIEVHASIPDNDSVFHADSYVLSKVRLGPDPDRILKTFDKTRVREPIRAAARRGVVVRQCTSKSDLYIFYDMLVQTHRRLGVPVQPKRFFSLVWDRLIDRNLGFLLLAFKDRVPVAGTVYLHHGNVLTAKYNASELEFWKLRPNHLVHWSAIQWGCEHGYRYFDFGRTEIANQGLRDFKQGWAAEEEPLTYATISNSKPHGVTRRLQPVIGTFIQRSPRFLCRAVGEMLYGHFA